MDKLGWYHPVCNDHIDNDLFLLFLSHLYNFQTKKKKKTLTLTMTYVMTYTAGLQLVFDTFWGRAGCLLVGSSVVFSGCMSKCSWARHWALLFHRCVNSIIYCRTTSEPAKTVNNSCWLTIVDIRKAVCRNKSCSSLTLTGKFCCLSTKNATIQATALCCYRVGCHCFDLFHSSHCNTKQQVNTGWVN